MRKLQNLSKDILVKLYLEQKESLGDIAKAYNVSRTAIYKKVKGCGIKQRSKSEARLEAQKQDKLPQQYFEINEKFFSTWSSGMAYVLGLLFTDGCVSKTEGGSYSVSLSLIDKDLLEKVRDAMGSKHPIKSYNPQRNLYHFGFGREKLMNDLLRLGLIKNKSLTVKFPSVPDDYLRDFIRGVFDGDGSIYFEPRSKYEKIRTSFTSSSRDFIYKLEEGLRFLGMPKRKIYQQKTKNSISYTLKYGHRHSIKLFSILYKDVAENMYLDRKYNKFIDGLKYSTKAKSYNPKVPIQEELREFKRLHDFDFEYKISDLAKRLNVSRRTVERWLSCKTKPGKEKLEGIRRYLDEKRSE
jgi:predicted DNA-binding protein YlxM (UPF0122 family)